ncbi:MAG: AraC family transcriptional regulator ligand-binding domain-containing protein, partial [Bacteroidota bacterium]
MPDTHRLEPGYAIAMQSVGLSVPDVLHRAGLPADLLNQISPTVTTDGFFRLWNAIGIESGDRPIGLELGEMISTQGTKPPMLAALTSPNLTVAMTRLSRFKALIGPVSLTVEADDDLVLTCHGRGFPIPQVLGLLELSYWLHLSRYATRTPVQMLRA